MAMTSAERQRKYRQKRDADPIKRQQYLEREKQKYKKDKEMKIKKSVKDMTEREKRSARKKWRKQKQMQKEKKKRELVSQAVTETPVHKNQVSRQKKSTIRKKKKEMAKCYRDIKVLQAKVNLLAKNRDMYKKKWQRLKEQKDKTNVSVLTPRSKTRHLLRNFSKKEVKRTLIFHNALIDQIKQSYKSEKAIKRQISSMLSGSILRKYKFKSVAMTLCGISTTNKMKTKTCLSKRLYKVVQNFFERDDVSRITTGLKNTVTFKKLKKQRRILNDSLKNLYPKYLTDNPKISYTTFCRLRPFWVLFPTDRDRNTCQCKICENSEFMFSSLQRSDVICAENLEAVVKSVVCDIENKSCMFGDCEKCNQNRIEINKAKLNDDIEWNEWRIKSEKRLMKSNKKVEEKTVTFTVKESQIGSVSDLADKFESQLERYKRHLFTIRCQFKYYRETKDNLPRNSCLLHIDFSENYICKLRSEIQSMHFGASKKQLSLHTGIYYIGTEEKKTFCTVSDCLYHGPSAIWAHMRPILTNIRAKFPHVDNIYIFSDGPTTQYRQKSNFFLLSSVLYDMGFHYAEWNFFESGHGKGIPDAVGGNIKRKADKRVSYGTDITSAKSFVDTVVDGETTVHLIQESQITKEQKVLEGINLKPIPGTMKLHQMIVVLKGEVLIRDVSCNCRQGCECPGHKLKKFVFNVDVENKLNQVGKENKDALSIKTKQKPRKRKALSESEYVNTRVHEATVNSAEKIENVYENYLKELKDCTTFEALQKKCEEISVILQTIERDPRLICLPNNNLEVDEQALDIYPNDVPDNRTLFPCKAIADGNCLASCGSIYSYGVPSRTAEMRIRILCELALNKETYLNNEFLSEGLLKKYAGKPLAKIYAQYSDMYVPGMQLDDAMIESIFKLEVQKIRINRSFMGIWQLHALSTVLHTPIFSIYPRLGNPNVRKDLNRLVIPRDLHSNHYPVYILWTSTRSDMRKEHWIPNHFVPVLPLDMKQTEQGTLKLDYLVEECDSTKKCDKQNKNIFDKTEQGDGLEKNSESKRNESKDKMYESNYMHAIETSNKDSNHDSNNKHCESEQKGNESGQKVTESGQKACEGGQKDNESGQKGNESEQKAWESGQKGNESEQRVESNVSIENAESSMKAMDMKQNSGELSENSESSNEEITNTFIDLNDLSECLEKYVVVCYESNAYLGFVLDVGNDDIYVKCMHKVGKKENCFFWPRINDKCWYTVDNILAIVPEPQKVAGSNSHYELPQNLWCQVCEKMELKKTPDWQE